MSDLNAIKNLYYYTNNNKKTGVIYCFHCIFSGKKYIGKSININKRLSRHRRNVKNNMITKFYSAVKKYGWDGFVFGIIEECDINILDEREIFYIEKYKTLNEGYNMTSGGDGGITWIPSEEIREKYRERMKNFKHSDETKKKISEANKGRKWNEESKKNLSKKLKGKKGPVISEEIKKKLSLERKGIPRPKEVIDKMIKTRKENYKQENHNSAKKFIFTSPNGEEYVIIGGFKKFCEEKNISHWGMRNIIRTGKIVPGCKNWKVRRDD
jgi:group I intron endonuclease